MTDPVLAAAAYLLLLSQPAQAVPAPIQQPRLIPCQLTMGMDPAPVQGSHHVVRDLGGHCRPGPGGASCPQNHLTIRLAPRRQYYDRDHRRRHHHEHFEDQR